MPGPVATTSRGDGLDASPPTSTHVRGRRLPAIALLAGILTAIAMTMLAGAPFVAAAGALLAVYAGGYVVGVLLVDRVDEGPTLAWAVIRTVAGLLLTTIGFLLSLVLSLPWFLLPGALVVAAVGLGGTKAFAWPRAVVQFRWDDVAAGVLTLLLLSPVIISTFYMAPGSYPRVFYHADTPYFLEKVHALVGADTYPPESPSNAGGRRTYHFGAQAMSALVSRASGLLPHHAVFLFVLPLLLAGVVAAAVAAAWYLSPALPRGLAVPLLLVAVPTLRSSFWGSLGPQLWTAVTSGVFSLSEIFGQYELWGIVSNQGQNVGGDFLILGSIAGIAAAPSRGWRLPVFLIGSGILVKTPVGIALLAGFALVEGGRALLSERLWPSAQMLAAAGVFLTTYAAFWVLPLVQPDFAVDWFPLYHLHLMARHGNLLGFVLDVLWLLLPVLIIVSGRIRDPEKRSVPILVMGIAPFLVVNATRMIDIREHGVGTDDDWIQIVRSAPFLFHAFALSVASRRWDRLGRRRRVAFLLALALAIAPVAAVAARYSLLVLRHPESGHEFVDNRPLAEALAVIPTNGTIVVTNDLRYPAERFRREDRQMQIPALFGHQAFAVNYAYEGYPFSRERRELQKLLQQPDWTGAIPDAARTHHWTHLVIHKAYVHPAPIPLERIFENQAYAVFRF